MRIESRTRGFWSRFFQSYQYRSFWFPTTIGSVGYSFTFSTLFDKNLKIIPFRNKKKLIAWPSSHLWDTFQVQIKENARISQFLIEIDQISGWLVTGNLIIKYSRNEAHGHKMNIWSIFSLPKLWFSSYFNRNWSFGAEFKDLGWMVFYSGVHARWRSPTTDLKISQSSIFDQKLHILSTIKIN